MLFITTPNSVIYECLEMYRWKANLQVKRQKSLVDVGNVRTYCWSLCFDYLYINGLFSKYDLLYT